MAKRMLSKAARFERMFKLLDYLKRHTDSEHPTSQHELRRIPELAEYIGDKETFNRLIKDRAETLNSGDYGYKPEKDWKLWFEDFHAMYGDDAPEREGEPTDGDFGSQMMHISGLYYNRTFSYDEIDSLIDGVLASKTLENASAQRLIEKIEDNLTTVYYKKGPRHICKVMEPELMDRELLRTNLLTLQRAIDDNVQVAFRFNGYSYQKQLEPQREMKDTVSPYYIVASGGRYYLIACREPAAGTVARHNMSVWRIDLMTEIEIPGASVGRETRGIPRIRKKDVENLPAQWSEDFQLSHLNMAFDRPELVTLRIKSEKADGDPSKHLRADYTFMHDWFGDSFQYVRTETAAPYDDIVRVECSPFAMTNWALQYIDRVEVLEPEHIRSAVIEKIRLLNEKYGLGADHASPSERG